MFLPIGPSRLTRLIPPFKVHQPGGPKFCLLWQGRIALGRFQISLVGLRPTGIWAAVRGGGRPTSLQSLIGSGTAYPAAYPLFRGLLLELVSKNLVAVPAEKTENNLFQTRLTFEIFDSSSQHYLGTPCDGKAEDASADCRETDAS